MAMKRSGLDKDNKDHGDNVHDDWENPLDALTIYSGLRRSNKHTAGEPPVRNGFDSVMVSYVLKEDGKLYTLLSWGSSTVTA